MAKITLSDVTNLGIHAVTTLNANSDTIEAAFENTLSRDGTSPNEMESDLDMNSNRILNLPTPRSDTQPVRLIDLASFTAGDYIPSQGMWTNLRLAKSANYTLLDADNGMTVALGGNALFTLTVGAATGYDANFVALIINEDSATGGRAKYITINGYSTFSLMPGQHILLIRQANAWQFQRPPLWNPVGGMPLIYVDHALGAGDGLAPGIGAFPTLLAAHTWLNANCYSSTNFNISLPAGTFFENFALDNMVGAPGLTITGQGIASTQWATTGVALSVNDNQKRVVIIKDLRMDGNGSGRVGIRVSKMSFVEVDNFQFGDFLGGINVIVEDDGYFNWGSGTLKVSGNCDYHLFQFGGVISYTGVVTIPTSISFNAWIYQQGGAKATMVATYTGTGSPSGVNSTGLQYICSSNSTLLLNSVTLPGATAGTTATGAIVIP